jgi:hypothetical protein
MAKGKRKIKTPATNWIMRHPVWSSIIGIFALMTLVGFFNAGDSSNTDYTNNNNYNYNEQLGIDVLNDYGYNAQDIGTSHSSVLGDYGYVHILVDDSSLRESAEEIGSGFGALSEVYPNMEYYIVFLDDGSTDTCTYGMEAEAVEKVFNGELSGIEIASHMDSTCSLYE